MATYTPITKTYKDGKEYLLSKYTPTKVVETVTNTTPTTTTIDDVLKAYDTDEMVNNYMAQYNNLASSGSESGGTGYTGSNIDLTNILKAYEDSAAASRAAAEQTYSNTRSDLLTSLKRYQEENAKNVENQKKSYLLGQASLESARAEADRQSRIGTTSRGLAGSGLQQLAQLQNLISQGQDISNLATENQDALETLRRALAQKEEDTNTSLANAETTYNNALKSIASELATNKANIEYQAAENEANRLFQAAENAANRRASASQAATSNALALAQLRAQSEDSAKAATSAVSKVIQQFKETLSTTKKKQQQNAYNQAVIDLYETLEKYNLGSNDSISQTALSNLKSVYNAYKK